MALPAPLSTAFARATNSSGVEQGPKASATAALIADTRAGGLVLRQLLQHRWAAATFSLSNGEPPLDTGTSSSHSMARGSPWGAP